MRTVLGLLDGPRLLVDGAAVAVPDSGLRLLALLAVRARPMPRHYVAATLWPDSNEVRARASLRNAVWRVRRASPDTVRDEGPVLGLASSLGVDITPLDDWAARVLHGDCAHLTVPAAVSAGLDLFRGWYDDWALVERERRRCRLLLALEAVCPLLSLAGRHAEAVEAASTALAADPLREGAQKALVAAHLAAGNGIEARRAVAAYARLLRTELGIDLTWGELPAAG